MSRLFTCDNCGDTFVQPLDQEEHRDEHGVTTMVDLCAPCRKKLNTDKKSALDKIVKKIKEK